MKDFAAKEPVEDLCCKHSPDESKQLPETSTYIPQRRGRKARLTPEQKRENKRQSDRNYRSRKADGNMALQKKCKELEEELKRQHGECKEVLPETRDQSAQADGTKMELTALKETVTKLQMAMKKMESRMDALGQRIINPEDPLGEIQMDLNYLDSMENVTSVVNLDKILTDFIGSSSGQGTATKTKRLPETVDFKGLKDNVPAMHEIFTQHRNIASGLEIEYESLRNCYMDTFADIYKKATKEADKLTLEEIKRMKVGIKDLKRAGLDVSWLNDLLVEECEE